MYEGLVLNEQLSQDVTDIRPILSRLGIKNPWLGHVLDSRRGG